MAIVPVILITGFLGSGKTTLINQILNSHPDKKISLILNEFGDIKLESKFVEVKGIGMVSELSGGCLCCVANVDLPRVIRYTLDQAPATQYLIIEASGLSDPDPVRATLTAPSLSSQIRLDTVVAVVDGENFLRLAPAHPLILSQIADADYALLSKTAALSDAAIDHLIQRVSQIGLGTKTIVWDNQFDTSIVFDPPLQPPPKPAPHHHSHTAYSQYFYQSNAPHDIHKLSLILRDIPDNVLRIKGYTGDYLLQKVGHHVDIRQTQQAPQTPSTAILFIGTNISTLNFDHLLANAKSSQ